MGCISEYAAYLGLSLEAVQSHEPHILVIYPPWAPKIEVSGRIEAVEHRKHSSIYSYKFVLHRNLFFHIIPAAEIY